MNAFIYFFINEAMSAKTMGRSHHLAPIDNMGIDFVSPPYYSRNKVINVFSDFFFFIIHRKQICVQEILHQHFKAVVGYAKSKDVL